MKITDDNTLKETLLERHSVSKKSLGLEVTGLKDFRDTTLSRIISLRTHDERLQECIGELYKREHHILADYCWSMPKLELFVHRWETGEYVFLPIIENVIFLHPTQRYWLRYYSFMKDLDSELRRREFDAAGGLFLGGRDSFGHLLQDFIPRAVLGATRTGIDSFTIFSLEKFSSLIGTILGDACPSVHLQIIPNIERGSSEILTLYNVKYIDWCAPSRHYWGCIGDLMEQRSARGGWGASLVSDQMRKRTFWDIPKVVEGRIGNMREIMAIIGSNGEDKCIDMSRISFGERAAILDRFRNIVLPSGSSWHNILFSNKDANHFIIINPNILASCNEISYHQLYILMMSDLVTNVGLYTGEECTGSLMRQEEDATNEAWRKKYTINIRDMMKIIN